jgi:hypothetical protein
MTIFVQKLLSLSLIISLEVKLLDKQRGKQIFNEKKALKSLYKPKKACIIVLDFFKH